MDLRKQLIRLAHENPGEVRDAILPLLKEANDKKVYVVRTTRGTETFNSEEALARKYRITGRFSRPGTRKELQGAPKLQGLLGPMYDGKRGGATRIRYEDKQTYKELSY